MKQVIFELDDEIHAADQVIDFYIGKDSLADRFFRKTLLSGVFDKEKDLRQLTVLISGRRAEFPQEALKKFIEESNHTDSLYVQLVTDMKNLIIIKDRILRHYEVINKNESSIRYIKNCYFEIV